MSSSPLIRVLIADDHAVVREGIRHVLDTDGGFEIVGEAADGQQAVDLAQALRPDVVVLDLSMPVLSGFDATVRIRETVPGTNILVLSMHHLDEYVVRSVRAGAHGYLRKDSSPAELRGAIRAIHEGGRYFSAPADRAISELAGPGQAESPQHEKLASLTSREREVLAEIAKGGTNKEIAAKFGISVRTVESHRDALMRKLELRGAAALTRFAVDVRLIS
jgi:two-component system nitrate/nitrite response regulator NarL